VDAQSQRFGRTRAAVAASLVDGVVRIDSERDDGAIVREGLVDAVARMGMPAVAVTDQGNLFALVKFYRAAQSRGLKPRARIVAMANYGDCPTLMLNAPVPAAKKVLAKAGLTTDDIDLFEINEAFAVVAAKFVRDLELDWDKVNVNGGSIALGHPIGATGSILIGTVVDELERRGGRYGLVTMCAAGGMAPAIIVERVDGFVD
jgi:acetyl-CoA C-acetyltransferase